MGESLALTSLTSDSPSKAKQVASFLHPLFLHLWNGNDDNPSMKMIIITMTDITHLNVDKI